MRRKGVALIDTIMAVVVLGVALPPMLMLLYQGVQSTALPEARVVATNLVRDRVEELITVRHEQGYDAVTTAESANSIMSGYPNFTRSTTLTEVDSKKTLIVRVEWPAGGTPEIAVRAAMVFADLE